jgi:hypothetical protein
VQPLNFGFGLFSRNSFPRAVALTLNKVVGRFVELDRQPVDLVKQCTQVSDGHLNLGNVGVLLKPTRDSCSDSGELPNGHRTLSTVTASSVAQRRSCSVKGLGKNTRKSLRIMYPSDAALRYAQKEADRSP